MSDEEVRYYVCVHGVKVYLTKEELLDQWKGVIVHPERAGKPMEDTHGNHRDAKPPRG